MSTTSLISQLHDGTDRWKIIVRIHRKWNVFHKSAPNELFCITMILVDVEGNKIQVSVLNKSLHDQFRSFPLEGHVYFIANFVLSKNENQFRATTHPFKIAFSQQTYIREDAASIPDLFSFFPISKIKKVTDEKMIDHLFDVIGYLKKISNLEEYRKDNETKHKLRMLLVGKDDNDVELVLYDECSTNAYMAQLEHKEGPIVVVINLCRIGFTEDGRPQISSSFNATRVLYNLAIKEVKEMMDSVKEMTSPMICTSAQSISQPSTQTLASNMMRNTRKINIAQIHDQPAESSFLISCVIIKLDTRNGWNYDGCSKCASKPKPQNGSLYCPLCKKKPASIETKLKLHYTVEDETGKVNVVFWDKLAIQLLGQTATELKVILHEDKRSYDFPYELDQLVGRKMLLKLKLNGYNKEYPSSSISVLQYTECGDLMNQFIEAVDVEEQSDGGIGEGIKEVSTEEDVVKGEKTNMENPIVVDNDAKDSPTDFHSNDINAGLDEMDVSQLIAAKTVPSTTYMKGKRRNAMKRSAVVDEIEKSSQVHASFASLPKPIKAIKQEK
ncbi:replication factor A protein 1-like [Prosopis cineraria]|uniref:replication factor A protein 1-like n=1 Tax=Prosopis cineraria TaxID=364024 RepID=UPI00240EE8F3|nr:replication factor A protein 1-like [Prosopis cineraria]